MRFQSEMSVFKSSSAVWTGPRPKDALEWFCYPVQYCMLDVNAKKCREVMNPLLKGFTDIT